MRRLDASRSLPAVVPAAGAARRFGADKLCFVIEGVAVLRRVLRSLASGGAWPLVVVVEGESSRRAELARHEGALVVEGGGDQTTMLDSILRGLEVAPTGPVLVAPADLPFLEAGTVAAVLATARAHPTRLVVPTHLDRRGHPLAIPGELRARIRGLDRALGLRALLLGNPDRVLEIPVADPGCVRDLDEPSDLPDASR